MFKKSILVENKEIKSLLSIIDKYYISKNNTIQEVSMGYVVNRIAEKKIRRYVINAWYNLERRVGHEIKLLDNGYKKSIINRLYKKSRDLAFIIKTRPDHSSKELHESIKKASSIEIVIKTFHM